MDQKIIVLHALQIERIHLLVIVKQGVIQIIMMIVNVKKKKKTHTLKLGKIDFTI
jgi:hypothetical protein